MIKSLKRNDIRYTPFVANKSWNSQNQRFEDLISWQSGSESGSLFLTFFDYGDGTQMSSVSSAFSSAIAYQQQDADFLKFRIGKEITGSTFYPLGNQYYNPETNPVNIDETYQSLVYNNAKNFYYKESENPTQIFGLESLDPSNVNRTLPKQIFVFNVSVNKFGEKIQPKSIKITHDLPIGYTTVIDDGNNNLKVSGSTFADIQNARYNCVSASISHANLIQTYNATQKSASVSTSPSNLTVSTTYNGNSNSPTNAGIYTVFSEISDGFYCGNKTDSFIINKSQASITVTNTSNTYTGNRFDVTVTTTPSNLNYNVVYRKNNPTGPISDPIDVGTYYATVTIEDVNYSGTATGTSTVSLPVSVITFNSIPNVAYGDTWEIQPIAVDNVNKFPVNFTITSGNNLATISDNKISLIPSKTATSLGTVTVTATTVPNIVGISPVSTTQTFTINQKLLTIIGVSTTNIIIGSGTTISINNQNRTLNGIIAGDSVSINTSPSTGTITSDSNMGIYPVSFSNYTVSGTHSSKYTLQQPYLTVQVTSTKIVFNSNLNFTYDTAARNVTSILTRESINSINDLTINYYLNSQRIGGEKYKGGVFLSKDGIIPTDVGNYVVEVINNELIVTEVSSKQISIKKAPAYVKFLNLTQGGSFWITTAQKSSKIKPISEEIVDVKITDVEIPDRNNKLISLPNLISDAIILYNGSPTKPTTVGSINVSATINSSNVYYANTQTLRVGNFIYIVTKDLYETYDFTSDNLVKDYSSSVYNLRKYFDPSVTGSWSSVTSTYSELSNFPYKDNSGYRYAVTPGIAVGLTGGGGGAYIYNEYKVTDKNVSIEYYNDDNTLISSRTNNVIAESPKLKDLFATTLVGNIIETTYFYVSENSDITFTLTSTNAELYIDDNLLCDAGGGDQAQQTSIQKKSFKRGYFKLKIVYYPINANSILFLKFNPSISFTTLLSYNYGGGSGASVGVMLPARYIIDNNLQQVKFVVGKSGFADINQDTPEITSRLNGQPAKGQGDRISNGRLKDNNNNILKTFLYNAPLLQNFYWLNSQNTEQNPPADDLIFIGKDVTQSQLNALGIKTPLNDLYRIKSGDTFDISSTAYVNDYLSIGYYIWDTSVGINDSYTKIYSQDYQQTDRQYSILSGQFIVPATFKSTDVLVIGFEDSSPFRRNIYGLNDLIVNVKLTFLPTPFDGGDTYFITGSSTSANINNAYLGIVAGGGRTINGINYGSSSIKGNAYKGNLYPTNIRSNNPPLNSYPLYSEFINYDEPGQLSYAINLTLASSWLGPYNQSVYGNNGIVRSIGGQSVDVTQQTNKNFGKGAGGSINTGTRGNFVLSGSNVLYEIYVNSSSVYNVTQVI